MEKIYVAGHRGMVGSAIVRTLEQQGQANFVTRTHAELDLTNQAAVQAFFASEKPTQVYLAAAKVANAPTVTIWGSGTPRREFLYVDDMAAASAFVMNLPKATLDAHTQPMQSHINVGFGDDITIKELAQAVGKTVGYQGVIDFDTSKPDGSPRKLMDSSRLNALGWQAQVGLKAGLAAAYQDFMSQLLAEEPSFLKSQTVTSIPSLRAQRGNPSPSPTQP